MNDPLRNSIWNLVLECISSNVGVAVPAFARDVLKFPTHAIPGGHTAQIAWLWNKYSAMPWYEAYNLLDYMAMNASYLSGNNQKSADVMNVANDILSREMSGYRFINKVLSPISGEAEVTAIQEAVTASSRAGLEGVRTHLATALTLLAKKPEADYRNSIKESISAVESAVKCIAGVQGGGLDAALRELAKRTDLHPAMKEGFLKLYGYTSDANGIRHAILEEAQVGFDEAKFMLVACSAFVNFLISKADTAQLLVAGS